MIWLNLIAVALAAWAILRWRRDPRIDRHFWVSAALSALNFGLFAFLGGLLLLLLWQPNVPRWHGLLLLGFIACWLLYGLVWLLRAGPHLRQPPAWLQRRGSLIDAVLVAATSAFGLGALLL